MSGRGGFWIRFFEGAGWALRGCCVGALSLVVRRLRCISLLFFLCHGPREHCRIAIEHPALTLLLGFCDPGNTYGRVLLKFRNHSASRETRRAADGFRCLQFSFRSSAARKDGMGTL
jgi:hypothetical protein